jgi:hypothetical protein
LALTSKHLHAMTSRHFLLAVLTVYVAVAACAAAPVPISSWTLAPSSNVTATPAQLSSTAYVDTAWLNVTLPCTVMACLLQNGLYPDIFHGDNLANVPAAQFNQTWWCVALHR